MSSLAPHLDDHAVVRDGCGVLDRSGERGRLALDGPEAASFLQGLQTNDVEALAPGEGVYAAVLDHKGRMLGDLRVIATDQELWLDTERVSLQPIFTVLHRGLLGRDAQLHKRTLQEFALSLIGPHAREIAGAAGAPGLPDAEHANRRARIAGIDVLVVATDEGVDLVGPADGLEAVRGALEGVGAHPVSPEAAEALRVERGRPRFGLDLDDRTIPQEAGLNERAVSFTKGCYVGQETVARLFYRGKPNRHLRGLRLSEPVEPGSPLRLGEREVGRVGSVAHSPTLGTIGLALVRREVEPGTELAAGGAGASARVAELPLG